MASARVLVKEEVEKHFADPDGWTLCLQWCLYVHDNGTTEEGYRFIWRRPKTEGKSLQAARGQARIPSLRVARELMAKAEQNGWGNFDAGDEE